MLHDTGRATYVPVTDDEAVDAFEYLSRTEGIIPAIESAHAVAYAKKLARLWEKTDHRYQHFRKRRQRLRSDRTLQRENIYD